MNRRAHTGVAIGLIVLGVAAAAVTVLTDAGAFWWSGGLILAGVGIGSAAWRLRHRRVVFAAAVGLTVLAVGAGISLAALPTTQVQRITGEAPAWEVPVGEEVFATTETVALTRDGDPDDDWTLRARDLETGRVAWQADPAPSATVRWVDEDVVLLRPRANGKSMVAWRALSTASGATVWEETLLRSLRAQHEGIGLFTWSTDTTDEISRQGVDLRTGKVVWSATAPTSTAFTQWRALDEQAEALRAPPTLYSPRVAAVSEGAVDVIDVPTGQVASSADFALGGDDDEYVDLFVSADRIVTTTQQLRARPDDAAVDTVRGFTSDGRSELWSVDIQLRRAMPESFWYQPWRLREGRLWAHELAPNRLRWVALSDGTTGAVEPPAGWTIDVRLEDGPTDQYVRVTRDRDDHSAFLDLDTGDLVTLPAGPAARVLDWNVIDDHLVVRRVDHNFVGEPHQRWEVLGPSGSPRASVGSDGYPSGQPWVSGDHIVVPATDSDPASVHALR